MSIQPQGEEIRRAVKWVSEEQKFNTQRSVKDMVEEACLKFDLSPQEADFLMRTFVAGGKTGDE